MKASLLTLLLLALAIPTAAAPPATAYSAKNASSKPEKPDFTGGTAPWLPKVKCLPSSEQLEQLAKKLSSRIRNVDPFGVATFPRDEAMPIFEEDESRPAVRITLNQALQTLKLNGVNLTQKEFLIGGRNVFLGDVIELSFRNEIFQAHVVEINATEIVFRDLIRDEAGILPHNMLPNLHLEPMRNMASALEERWAPMEPVTPPKK